MQKHIFGFVIMAVPALALVCGCGKSEPMLPQSELEAKRGEIRSMLEQADFYFDHSYFVGAKGGYEEIVRKAKNYLYYDPRHSEVEAILKKAQERLGGMEIAEGNQGRIRMGENWVDPEAYYAAKAEKLRGEAGGDFAKKMSELEKALKESQPVLEGIMENETVQEILAAGAEATPFVLRWLDGEDREMRDIAFALLEVMEEREEIIFTWALSHAGADLSVVRNQSVALLKRFPRGETAAALVPHLGSGDERLLEAVVTTLCEAKTELGKRVLLETARESSKTALVRMVILRNIYLLKDKDAVGLLAEAACEASADQSQSYVRSVSIKSLLQMDIPETLPAFTEILQRLGKSDRDVAVEILKRIKQASYADAVSTVVKTFMMFTTDREVTELAVDYMEIVAGPDNINDLISMVLTMDFEMEGATQVAEKDNLFVRITNIIKRVRNDKTAGSFMDMLTPSQAPGTVARAVHALGVLEEESAVPKMWEVYRLIDSNMVKIAVVNALARIGSRQAMEHIARILKSSPPPEVLKYAVANVPRLIVSDSAFRELFAELDGVPEEVLADLFAAIGGEKKPASLRPLLDATRRGAAPVRLGAFRALASFKGIFTEEDITELNQSILDYIAELQKEPDVTKVAETFGALKLHVDNAMKTFMHTVRAEYWPIGYYSAEALASASFESVGRHREQMRAIYDELVNKRKDYHSGLLLAGCLGMSKDEIEGKKKASEDRVKKIVESRAAGVALGDTLKSLREKFGEDYEQAGPEGSRSLYVYYRPLGLVFALGEAAQPDERQVWGIGYVSGFEGAAYGAKIGEAINNVLMIAGPPPGLNYMKEYDAYAAFDGERGRWIMYLLSRARTVRYVAETVDRTDEKQRMEFRDVLDAVYLGD